MEKSGPTAPLPKDPQPTVDRVDELARRVLSGDILLPKFQREFVWGRSQVLNLLDSVYRNYPIGSVLLWQSRQELRSENYIADLEIRLPKPDYPVNYLLDGQQRLSTVCGAIYWNGSNPESIWNVAFDLKKQEFIHLQSLDDPPLHVIRMNKLSDPSIFFQHVSILDSSSSPDKETIKSTATALFNRFKDYKIAVVTLGDMKIEDVAPIFERINSTGTRLTIVDLMRAATWSQNFDLIDTIDGVLETLNEKNFGGIDRKAVLRNLSAAAGGGFSVESIDNLRNHDSETLKSAASETEEAYKKSVDFFMTEINIPSDSVIPYQNQIVVLTEIFRLLPRPSAQQFSEIKKWFWRTTLSGYFAGWNTGNMSTDLRTVQAFGKGDIKTIEFTYLKPRSDIWSKKVFRVNNAHAKALAITMGYFKPIDILNGQSIDVSKALAWTNAKEFHHFFPRAFLKSLGVHHTKINCLANIIYLTSSSNKIISDRKPSEYLIDLEKAAGSNLSMWLNSNLITEEAFESAKNDDFDTFIKLRSETIQQKISELANW